MSLQSKLLIAVLQNIGLIDFGLGIKNNNNNFNFVDVTLPLAPSTTHTPGPNRLHLAALVHCIPQNPFWWKLQPKKGTHLPLLNMCGQQFSKDLCWAVVHAEYHGLDSTEISALTGISEQQIRQICGCYHQTGEVRTVHAQWGTET